MKKNIIIAMLLGATVSLSGLYSCKPDYETDFTVYTLKVEHRNQAPINFARKGGESMIPVKTNVALEDWTVKSNADWCQVDKEQNQVIVKADGYDGYKVRKAVVTIAYGHQKYNISVSQLGKEAVFQIEGNEDFHNVEGTNVTYTTIQAKEDKLIIPLRTNLIVDHVIVPDTVSWVHYEAAESQSLNENGVVNLKIDIDPNTDLEDRLCTLTLQSSQNFNLSRELVIKQLKRGAIVVPVQKEYTVSAAGELLRIPYKRNADKSTVKAEIIGDASSWLTIKNESKVAVRALTEDAIIVEVAPNIQEEPRTGKLRIKTDNAEEESTFDVTITQKKFVPVPPNNVVELDAEPGEGFIMLHWEAPVDANYSKVMVTWHDPFFNIDRKLEVTDKNITELKIEPTFTFAGEYEFKVRTVGPTGLESEEAEEIPCESDEWSNDGSIKLTANMITANATQAGDGQGIPGLVDGNSKTFYHSSWQSDAPGKKPHFLQFALKSAIPQFIVNYTARMTSDHAGDVKVADIYVSNENTNVEPSSWSKWKKVGTMTFDISNDPSGGGVRKFKCTGPVDLGGKYKYIRFVPTEKRGGKLSGEGKSSDWWNMGDIYIFGHVPYTEAWAETHKDDVAEMYGINF